VVLFFNKQFESGPGSFYESQKSKSKVVKYAN